MVLKEHIRQAVNRAMSLDPGQPIESAIEAAAAALCIAPEAVAAVLDEQQEAT